MVRIVNPAVRLAVLALLLSGCMAYEPRPLDAPRVVAEVDRQRSGVSENVASDPDIENENAEGPGSAVTLAQAAAWMRQFGPEIREAVATYRRALREADVKTPLPNPQLQIGPEFGFGDDVTFRRVQPFGTLNIRIPLSDRRAAADGVELAEAEQARIDGLARHKELFLQLRRQWLRRLVATRLTEARRELVEAAGRSASAARRLVDAGSSTALDLALFRLEEGRARAALVNTEQARLEALAALGALVGVRTERFGDSRTEDLPPIPEQLPDLEILRAALVDHHPELARRRAAYEVNEARLRLEIARQYPDLQIGPYFRNEVGEKRNNLGLTLGIQLPIFDQNQKGIAASEAAREEARLRFETAANRALNDLERACAAVRLAGERRRILQETVLRQVEENIELARRAVRLGAGDALRLLDAERSYREVRIEVLQAELAEREAWCDLELAVGRPLLRFPGESQEDAAAPPAALRAPAAEAAETETKADIEARTEIETKTEERR